VVKARVGQKINGFVYCGHSVCSFSTFFLTKKWSKKSRTAQSLRVPVRASAQGAVFTGGVCHYDIRLSFWLRSLLQGGFAYRFLDLAVGNVFIALYSATPAL
jgi:hypothetical protein